MKNYKEKKLDFFHKVLLNRTLQTDPKPLTRPPPPKGLTISP